MKKEILAMLIVNLLALIFTVCVNVFEIGGNGGYLACMTMVLCFNVVYLVKVRRKIDK